MSANAIPTEYKGYKFRSRTEARWAVFFDTLGIRWDYEFQGFSLGAKHIRYLPDFYMPDWNKYVEIKPLDTIKREEVEKAALLVQYEGKPVVMLLGQPWPEAYVIRLIIPCNDPATRAPYTAVLIPPDRTGQFGFAPHSNRVYIHYREADPALLCLNLDLVVDNSQLLVLMDESNANYLIEDMRNGIYFMEGPMDTIRDLLQIDTILQRAYIAARQASFEFKQTGMSIDQALKMRHPLLEGLSPFFNSDVLATVRSLENDALKGQQEGYKYERSYVLGESVAAWVQPGATVLVQRLARGIRTREYKNILKATQDTKLMVIDIKTEEIFNDYKSHVSNLLDSLFLVRIEYDSSYHLIALVQGN